MIRPKWIYSVAFIFLTIANFNNCDKEETPVYDLFPLKVGNEYFYKYYYQNDHVLIGYQYQGNEEWTVISDSSGNGFIEYQIERKLNGICVKWSDLSPDIFRDTLNIHDSIYYLTIRENISSSELNLLAISFNRYTHVRDTMIQVCDNDMDPCKSFYFHADSGLTKYYYNEGLMTYRIRESLMLDSLKID